MRLTLQKKIVSDHRNALHNISNTLDIDRYSWDVLCRTYRVHLAEGEYVREDPVLVHGVRTQALHV